MKLTAQLCKRSLAFGWRRIWGSKRIQYPDFPARVPQILADKGVEIVDVAAEPEEVEWRPPVDDPRFYQPPKAHELWNYNEEPAYVCNTHTCMHQGVKQAACLAKTQVYEGLPSSVQTIFNCVQLPPDTNSLLQRYIMQAQYWNTTKERLPKRIEPRKPGWKFPVQYGIPAKKQASILIRNLLRLCQSQVATYPGLSDRRHVYHPNINSHFFRGEEAVIVRGVPECLMTSARPLPTFANEELVDASAQHALPDLFPLLPTIDLMSDHNYTLDHNTGIQSSWMSRNLHTIVITDANHHKTDQRVARDILFCLGYATAHARQLYGETNNLPEPVCVQCISLDHQTLNFVCFQLNTLSLTSPHGIKNQVWVDSSNHLFQKHLSLPWMPKAIRYERLEDLDPVVFQKLLAVYLNGDV